MHRRVAVLPKKKHPDFSCDKSFISGDSAGWAGEENEVRLGPPPRILDIGPNRRSTEALACLAIPPLPAGQRHRMYRTKVPALSARLVG